MEEWSVEKPDNYPLGITPSLQYSRIWKFCFTTKTHVGFKSQAKADD